MFFPSLFFSPPFYNLLANHSQILQTAIGLKSDGITAGEFIPLDTRGSTQCRALRCGPSCGKSFAQSLCFELVSQSPRCRFAGNMTSVISVLREYCNILLVAEPCIQGRFCALLQDEGVLLETGLKATADSKAGVSDGLLGLLVLCLFHSNKHINLPSAVLAVNSL